MVHICINVWNAQFKWHSNHQYGSIIILLNMTMNCKRKDQTTCLTPDPTSLNCHSCVRLLLAVSKRSVFCPFSDNDCCGTFLLTHEEPSKPFWSRLFCTSLTRCCRLQWRAKLLFEYCYAIWHIRLFIHWIIFDRGDRALLSLNDVKCVASCNELRPQQ